MSDAMLRAVLDELPDPVIVVDASGIVLWTNQIAEEFFGFPDGEARGMMGLDLVHPDDLEYALLSMVRLRGDNRELPTEVRLRTPDGWCLAEIMGEPLGGPLEGSYVLSIRDLTDRRSLEVATGDDAKFRSLVHNAASLMILVSADGVVRAASGALSRLVGQDPVLVIGGHLTNLVHPPDRSALAVALRKAALGPQGAAHAPTVEVRLWHLSEDATVPFELTIVNLLEDPTVGAFVVSGHDLTSRKAIEAELLSALSLLSGTLDSTGDGILVINREGKITTVNHKLAELWDVSEEVILAGDEPTAVAFAVAQILDPEPFAAKVADLTSRPAAHTHDVLRFRDGRVLDCYTQPQYVDGEIVGRVWCFRDSTERVRLQEQLAHQALHDSLTGLANQSLFRDRVDHALARVRRTGGHLAVLFLDIDNFKTVNDSLGHSAGDLLLVGVAERLAECLRVTDTAARLGGDEFAILLEDLADDSVASALAERLLRAFKQTFTVDATEVSATVSIGIAVASEEVSSDQLLRNADLAMYTAKRTGKGRVESYESGMHKTAVARLYAEAELRRATESDEITAHYQPIVDLATGGIVAVEALARWQHPARGLLGADAFIGLAEETGLIEDIGRSVFAQACADLRRWRNAGIAQPSLRISVNLAPRQLAGERLHGEIVAQLAQHDLEPECLILEITEGAMMLDTDAAIATLTALRELGVRIAVDDFGTGYSSLSYLQRFPIDILKIDKSFIDGIDSAPDQSALAEAIISLAQTLGLTSIAEGVERAPQRARLLELGCQLAQGYHFAAPVATDALAELLRAET